MSFAPRDSMARAGGRDALLSLFIKLYRAGRRAGALAGLRRLGPARSFDTMLASRVRRGTVNVRGHWMQLDSVDALQLAKRGIYEPAETRFLESRVDRGSIAIDVGANIGYYTLLLARLVGETGKVFAFEPSPQNFALLRRNIELNGYANVDLAQAAVSDRAGTLTLYLCEDNPADHRSYQPPSEKRESIVVESQRLDDRLAELSGQVTFVKLDIQGTEWRALDGMENVLRRSPRCCLMTEFWPFGLAEAGCEPGAYLDRLVDLGLQLHELEAQPGKLRSVRPAELLERYTVENRRFSNIICERDGSS